MFNGKKVALLATGGGARAVAHAGVIKACEEIGIEFDLLIGASAGSIAAVYYTQYESSDAIIDNFKPKKERKFDFEQFGWHRVLSLKKFFSRNIKNGLFDLSAAEEFFKRTLVTDDFNELKKPVYISVTNLSTNTGMLLGPGCEPNVPISKAIVASCCFPMLFRPVKIGEHYYVDGEIKRPLSIQSAIDFGADMVVVSDMYMPCQDNIDNSGMFNITSQIGNMLLEDKTYRALKLVEEKYPDKQVILISPPIGKVSVLSMKLQKKLIDIGYEAAMKKFEESGVK